MWFLCKQIYHTGPDDPRITEMDPVQKIWMYENWLSDQNDQAELAKNHAYLLASFSNPEAVKDILGEGNMHVSTNDEFEDTSKLIKEMNQLQDQKSNKSLHRRKRRTIKG